MTAPSTMKPVTSVADPRVQVLARHQDVATYLDDAHEAAWQAVDPVLLELCRLRVAMLLRNPAALSLRTPAAVTAGLDEAKIAQLRNWPTSTLYDERDSACLAFCEQFVIDVANLTDEQGAAVSVHLGPQGLADFVSALLTIEQRQRLSLAWPLLLDLEEVA